MKYCLGIDTGTTSISIVTLNEAHELTDSITINHSSFIAGEYPESRVQDSERITRLVLEAVEGLISKHGQPSGIGLTGQMHGMLYVNAKGGSVSPLYTWQDISGNIPINGKTSIELLREHGLKSSPGYGLSTHLYLQRSGNIPEGAVRMTTISDYIAMKLCGNSEPVLSSEMAASWGGFDIERREFMTRELECAGVDVSYLPRVTSGCQVIGSSRGVPVVCSMGDNQASVKGSLKDEMNSVLLNVGTGSQVSMIADKYVSCEGDVEVRPYGEKFLLAGSGLCGGRAYAMLEKFYRDISGRTYYEDMMKHAEEFIASHGLSEAWSVETTFMGTRSDPSRRGSIAGISEGNFCAGAFTAGVIRGILSELHAMYVTMKELAGREAHVLVGSGNGLRKNELMQRMASEMFGMSLRIPECTEEAASGAAMCAAEVC